MTKPIRILSYGGGIQSTAILVMACNGSMGVELDHAIFADTGDEPPEVYATVERARVACEKVGIGFHVVSYGNLLEDMERKGKNKIPCFTKGEPIEHRFVTDPSLNGKRVPIGQYMEERGLEEGDDLPDGTEESSEFTEGRAGPVSRTCTVDYKVKPITKKVKELLGLKKNARWPKEVVAHQILGFSTDEARRLRVSIEPWFIFEYPLIRLGLNREHCAAYLREEGWPDVTRSACVYCPHHKASEWRAVWPQHRDKILRAEAAAKRDPSLRNEPFLHRSLQPIEEAIANMPEDDNDFFGEENDCLGHCGI